MSFMNNSLHTFDALLELEDIDSDIREINRTAVLESINIYKEKYAELLEQAGGYYANPNIILKRTQIEQMIKRLEDRYPDSKKQEVINQKMKQEDELMSFMNETIQSFDTLLQLDDIDEDTHDTIKNAVSQSLEIYKNKYAQLLEQMGGKSRNPNIMLRQSQINQIIKRLEAQYDIIQKEEEIKDNKTSVKESKQELLARLQREYPLDILPDSNPMKEVFENARMKSMEDLYDEFTRKYSLEGIQESRILSEKLHEMLYDGLDYSCNPSDPEKVARFEILKHIVPQYSELRSAIITLREINIELEEQLLGSLNLSDISYQELLNKANAMIQEISQPEKTKTQDESIKDEIGDEFKTKTPSEKQGEQEAQALWTSRLQLSDKIVDRVAEGADDKRNVVKLIQELEQRMSKDKNKQIQEENKNEGQR